MTRILFVSCLGFYRDDPEPHIVLRIVQYL